MLSAGPYTDYILVKRRNRKAISVVRELPVEFDLGLLMVYDPNPIDQSEYEYALFFQLLL